MRTPTRQHPTAHTLNESPSEKEGKSQPSKVTSGGVSGSLNESPSEKEGK